MTRWRPRSRPGFRKSGSLSFANVRRQSCVEPSRQSPLPSRPVVMQHRRYSRCGSQRDTADTTYRRLPGAESLHRRPVASVRRCRRYGSTPTAPSDVRLFHRGATSSPHLTVPVRLWLPGMREARTARLAQPIRRIPAHSSPSVAVAELPPARLRSSCLAREEPVLVARFPVPPCVPAETPFGRVRTQARLQHFRV